MSDYLEVYGEQAAFASLRTPGWHTLGTVFDKPVTTEEMLRLAHLNGWNVRLIEIEAPGFNFATKYYMVVRDNPFVKGQQDVLHVSGERYVPFQNEQLFDIVSGIEGIQWETAGSIKGGTQVFGSLTLDHDVVLDPNGVADRIKNYLLVTQGHNGTLAIQGGTTPVRVVCSNTLNMALGKGFKQSFKFRHTPSAAGKAEQMKKALAEAHNYIKGFEAKAQQMISTPMNDMQFWNIINAAYPKPDEDAKSASTRWEKKVDELVYLRTADTNAMWADTAWGGYNTLIERLDWFRKGRGENAAENVAAARSGFDVATNAEKNRLLKVVESVLS